MSIGYTGKTPEVTVRFPILIMMCYIPSVPTDEQLITCTNELLSLYIKVGLIRVNSQRPVGLIAICSFTPNKKCIIVIIRAREQRYRVVEYL